MSYKETTPLSIDRYEQNKNIALPETDEEIYQRVNNKASYQYHSSSSSDDSSDSSNHGSIQYEDEKVFVLNSDPHGTVELNTNT